VASAHTHEHLAGHGSRRDRGLLGHLQRLQLVRVVEEVGRHRRRVHGQHINAAVAHFNRQRRRELRHERLGGAVHHRERVGDVARHRGSEDEAALHLLVQHLLEEVVGDLHAGGGVALQVGQLSVQGGLVEETSHDVASVVEHNLDIDVLGGLKQNMNKDT